MKPLTIRAGLTAWFAGLTLLLLAVFSIATFAAASGALRDGLDARLAARAQALAALCEWDEDLRRPVFELRPEVAERLARGAPGASESIHVWPTRKPLHAAGEEFPLALPEVSDFPLGGAAAPRLASVTGAFGRRRVLATLATIPAYVDDEGYTKREFSVLVRVGEDLGPLAGRLSSLGRLIALLAALAALTILVFAALISRRVVRPLRELGEAAAAIRAGRAGAIPSRGTGDEVDQLAEHLDSAFARLEEARERQARFTADASHELRNPISAIRSGAEVALRRERTTAEYQEFLREILDGTERMGRVVEALLLLARADRERDAARHESVDLAAVARAAAADRAEDAARLRVEAGRPAAVTGDPTLLRVLADNLLGNALRYSNDGEPVVVTVVDGGEPTLAVEDAGPGIPEAERARVFERFYRGTAAPPGSDGAGLGLALVAEIARVHGARCELDTEPGRTVFRVRFPRPAAPQD